RCFPRNGELGSKRIAIHLGSQGGVFLGRRRVGGCIRKCKWSRCCDARGICTRCTEKSAHSQRLPRVRRGILQYIRHASRLESAIGAEETKGEMIRGISRPGNRFCFTENWCQGVRSVYWR